MEQTNKQTTPRSSIEEANSKFSAMAHSILLASHFSITLSPNRLSLMLCLQFKCIASLHSYTFFMFLYYLVYIFNKF
ncbi:hypothetical protein RIF29_30991 [Crotalaria pallida]|uniref:Uncharacterized protein n=1 Tax=Crotalaria pallida TaxID=3830 RepID=A0AAN9HV03_CROPI